MKYCPSCRREYVDFDNCCPEDGVQLRAREAQSAEPCELCGRIVERGERACKNCGAKVDTQESSAGFSAASFESDAKKETPKAAGEAGDEEHSNARWFGSRDDDLPEDDEIFRFDDSPGNISNAKRIGGILVAAGFVAGIAFGLVIMHEAYDTNKPANEQQGRPQSQMADVSRSELPPLQSNPFIDKSLSTETLPPRQEIVPPEQPLKPDDSQESLTTKIERRAPEADKKAAGKSRVPERSTPISLKIPSGVRIPSPAELRRKKAQHEAEQAMENRTIPAGVEIPSPVELRRKRIEHEIEQAIQNRAIEGVTVSLIGNTIYLRGQVETERQKAAAEQAARGVPEVGNIRSSISVRATKG